MTRTVSPSPEQLSELLANDICRDVCELPDRTSPDDWPEACLVTPEELRIIVVSRLTDALESTQAEIARLTTVSGDMAEEMREAIWNARQDPPQGDYALKMRLSYDEATRAAQAAATIAKGRIETAFAAGFNACCAHYLLPTGANNRGILDHELEKFRAALKGGDA